MRDNWRCGIPDSWQGTAGTTTSVRWDGSLPDAVVADGRLPAAAYSRTAFWVLPTSSIFPDGSLCFCGVHRHCDESPGCVVQPAAERSLDSPEFADASSWNDSKYRDRRRPQPNQEQEKPTLYCLRPALLSLRLILCIAVQAVVNSPPDGYTLLFLGASAIVNTSMNGSPHHFSRPQPAPALSMSCRPRCGETWVGGASSQPTATMDQALTTIILSTSCAFASCDLPSSSGRPP